MQASCLRPWMAWIAFEPLTVDERAEMIQLLFGAVQMVGRSSTPVLVLRFEGQTEAALHRIEADCMAALRAVKPDAQFAAAAH